MKLIEAKIFGERNTGTNALAQIMVNNFRVTNLPGTIDAHLPDRACNLWKRLRPYIPPGAREQLIDLFFAQKTFRDAWKHAGLSGLTYDGTTKVLFCVRNPLSWIDSLRKNPYHCKGQPPVELLQFCNWDWKLLRRDNLQYKTLKPLKLYENKLRSYLEFIEINEIDHRNYKVIQLENLVCEQKKVIEDLGNFFEKEISSVKILTGSTKSNNKNLLDYNKFFGEELWKKNFNFIDIEELELDRELFRKFGYDNIKS